MAGASGWCGSMRNSRGRSRRERNGRGKRRAAKRQTRRGGGFAAELELPVSEDGKVLFPDAQIEYTDAAGRAGRASVEVASQHYSGATIPREGGGGISDVRASGRRGGFRAPGARGWRRQRQSARRGVAAAVET